MAGGCRIIFNRETCAGIGLCEMHAPEYFEIADDGDGRMVPRSLIVDADDRAAVEEAVSSCPTASIAIADE